MRWIVYFIKLGVAGGLIYWLIDGGLLDLSPLIDGSLSIYFFLVPVCLIANLVLAGMRWSFLLRVHNSQIRLLDVIGWQWIGEFFALFTPGGGGGELARAYYAFRSTEQGKIAALSTVILDRLIGLHTLLLLGAASLAFLYIGGTGEQLKLGWIGGMVLMLLLGVSIFFLAFNFVSIRTLSLYLIPASLKETVTSMYDAYLKEKKAFFSCFVISLLSQIFLLGAFYLAGMHLDTPVDFSTVLLVVPLIFLANTLPISPGGIGVGETAASFLLLQFGIANGAAIMLIVRLSLIAVQLPGVLFFLAQKNRKVPNDNAGQEST